MINLQTGDSLEVTRVPRDESQGINESGCSDQKIEVGD
jgi:hypothetical protein